MEGKTPLQRVFDVFIDYYGEDRVDLQVHSQNSIMLIYFPRVTITNENNMSINITELYVKIIIDNLGKLIGTFTLNRSEYSVDQWEGDYMHSHISGIPKHDPKEFMSPCLGSGPIRGTCTYLNTIFDEDIWGLFALEIDKYVHTESVSGVPYRYLEKVGTDRMDSNSVRVSYQVDSIDCIPSNVPFNAFISYLIEKRPFSFGFSSGYYIADSPINIIIKVSNLFIEWYNSLPTLLRTFKSSMFDSGSLIICKINNGDIFRKITQNYDYSQLKRIIGRELWVFKGKTITLNITGIPKDGNPNNIVIDENYSILLHPDVVMYIVTRILKIINYKYGRAENSELNQREIYI